MIYRVTALETALAAGATSDALEWAWPRRGIVLGYWLGTEDNDLSGRGGLGVSFYRQSQNMVRGNFGRQFVSSLLGGGADDAAIDWDALGWDVENQEPVVIQLQNAGAAAVTPRLLFFVAEGQ